MTYSMDQDALNAALDVIGRAGAQHLEVGFLNDDVPVQDGDWYATAQWRGTKLTVEHRTGPVEAAEALARKVINGGRCTHCGQTITLSREVPRSCVQPTPTSNAHLCHWTRRGDTWERGCLDTHPEGERRPELLRHFRDTLGRKP